MANDVVAATVGGPEHTVKLRQRALLFHRVEYEFADKILHYRIEDERTRVGFSILYERIEKDTSQQTFSERGILYIADICGALFLVGLPIFAMNGVEWILLILSFLCFHFWKDKKVNATVIATPMGKLLIFDRALKKDILEEIYRRRTSEIRRKYHDIDFFNDPSKEISKFHWLKSQDAISESELSNAILKITAAHQV